MAVETDDAFPVIKTKVDAAKKVVWNRF